MDYRFLGRDTDVELAACPASGAPSLSLPVLTGEGEGGGEAQGGAGGDAAASCEEEEKEAEEAEASQDLLSILSLGSTAAPCPCVSLRGSSGGDSRLCVRGSRSLERLHWWCHEFGGVWSSGAKYQFIVCWQLALTAQRQFRIGMCVQLVYLE